MDDEEVIRIYLDDKKKSWVDEFALPEDLTYDFQEMWDLHPEDRAYVRTPRGMVKIPRYQQSYGTDYYFSGVRHLGKDTPAVFQKFLDWANTFGYANFNQVMVNWYENGYHYIGKHRDDEKQLVKKKDEGATIFSISLGTTRKFRFRNYKTNEIIKDIMMPKGTVLVFGGRTNIDFTHEVVPVKGEKGKNMGPRINITFRQFWQDESTDESSDEEP